MFSFVDGVGEDDGLEMVVVEELIVEWYEFEVWSREFV